MRHNSPENIYPPIGFSMPAEWAPHDATWLAWPHNHADWPGKFAPIPWVFAEIVRHLACGERVHLIVPPSQDHAARKAAADILEKADANLSHITFHEFPTNRVWLRDSGPIFTKKGSALAAIDFKFNAWAKYDDSELDDDLPAAIAETLSMPCVTAFGGNNAGEHQRFVLEGGSIDVNGAGALLTTEECLLSKIQQRNPGFSRDRIERTLCDFLGVQKILWLKDGIIGDDTHGHVDDTARFTDPTTILACTESNRRDPNHRRLRENARRVKSMRDTRGRQFTLAELPMPDPVYFDSQRLPASYANFYIANTGILVPVFNDPQDARALKVLEACFKGRPIIPIYCRDLVWGLGTIHCLTQQQPST